MGTALATLLARAGKTVALWSRDPKLAATLRETRANPRYLQGVELPENVRATSSIEQAVDRAELIVAAIPSAYLRRLYGDFESRSMSTSPS